MGSSLAEQIEHLKQAIAEIEAQRRILGDVAANVSLAPIHQKLAELEAQAETPPEEPAEIPTRHRKLVTLLYMDVVGSTAMTQHLDPEDTLEIMDNALPRLAAPIEVHGGHVTRYTGDGFKAVFGDPVAREDDPEHAIRAGLEILEVAKSLAQELETEWGIEEFQVRIGIDTGLAALGGQTEAEDTVMGKVVNLAVRIESAAPPGGLLISHNTYRHVRGVFNVESQEAITAKGFPEPVLVYLVRELKPRAFRVQTRGVEGIETRMVGREAELKFLQDALLTAIEEGEGQVITISGEAGVGKSRLLYEFQNWIELLPEPLIRFYQGRGRQESQGLPYSLLRDLFAFRFQILDDDSGDEAREKIETGFCDILGVNDAGLLRAHILGQLLGFDFSGSPHLMGLLEDAKQLRNRGLIYLGEYFQAVSIEAPTVLFLEDIHWADDSSLDFVNHLGHRTVQQRTLIVAAARHSLFERRPYWGEGLSFHRRVELEPLSRRESRQLVAEILKLAEDIPTQLRELVIHGAEGNPFYLEELIKMLIEDGVVITGDETWVIDPTRLEQVDVPSTLAGVLQARLDSLPPEERTVLQQASVVGRLFWDRIVAYIQSEAGDGNPDIVPPALTSLRGKELVYRHEESAFVDTCEYIFKHEVLREVTYESVLKRLRRTYHGIVADWLIANSGERIGELKGLIAEHLLLAKRKDQALPYFIQAGETALASYANPEAERYFRTALTLSPTEDQRAKLLSGLGEALNRQGQTEEALQVYRQGIDLYQTLEDCDGIAYLYTRSSQADYIDNQKRWGLCQEGLALLENAPDSLGLARLLVEAGRVAYFYGVSDEVAPLCNRAMGMAERIGSIEVQADARITLSMLSEDFVQSVTTLKDVVALTEANGLLGTAARAHNNLGFLVGNLGELESAFEHFIRAAEIARLMGDTGGVCFFLQNAHEVACNLGRLQEASQILTEIEQIQTFAPGAWTEYLLKTMRSIVFYAKGQWLQALNETRALLKEAKCNGDMQGQSNFVSNLALITLELNRFAALSEWNEVEREIKESLDIGLEITKSNHPRYRLAITHARKGDSGKAQELYEEEKNTIAGPEVYMDQVLRLWTEFELAYADERWSESIAACESLVEICERSEHRWDWARRLIDLGDAYLGRNEPGDLEKVREIYQQSLDMFIEMGAPGYIKVLEERLGSIGD